MPISGEVLSPKTKSSLIIQKQQHYRIDARVVVTERRRGMDGYVKRMSWICAIGGISISGGGTMILPFLPLYLLDLGATKENVAMWTAVVSSVIFLVGAICMPWWGALSDRVGKKKMILRSAGCLALAYFIGSLVQTPLQLMGMRMFQGFSFGYFPISQSLLTAVAGTHASEAIGILMSGRGAGTVLGPFIGGLLAHFTGIRMSFVLAAAANVVTFIAIFFLIHEPKNSQPHHRVKIVESFKALSHNHAFMTIFALMVVNQAAILMINPIIALHIADLKGSYEDVDLLSGLIVGSAGVAGMVSAPLWGKFCQKSGVYRVIFYSFFGAGLFALAQFLAPTVLTFGICQFGFGLFIIGGTTALTGAVAECIDPDMRGSAFGLLSTAMNVGNFIGPLSGGFLASIADMNAVFFAAGLIQIGGALWIRHKENP